MSNYDFHEAEVTIQIGGRFTDAIRERVEDIVGEIAERLACPEQFRDEDAKPVTRDTNVTIRWVQPIKVDRG